MEPKKKLKKFNDFKTEKKILEEDIFVSNPSYRYFMEFPLGDTLFNCFVNCEIPSFNRQHHVSWEQNLYRGMTTMESWQPIQIKIRDVIGDEIIKRQFYDKIRDFFSDYNHNQRKINSTILRIDPLGGVVNRWDLRGCFISALHYSPYYDSDEIELEMTLHYDFCSLNF